MTTTVEHWFDFLCPFCYIAQDRNRILRERGVVVHEHPLQIHPEIGPGGSLVGTRVGPTYDFLGQQAEAAGLPLQWTDRIAYSLPALGAYATLSAEDTEVANRFAASVFNAYFGEGKDIESRDLLVALTEAAGGDPEVVRAAWESGEADQAVGRSAILAYENGVQGTPAWVGGGQSFSGLRKREFFENWADSLTRD
ncbi:DsbA family protein [Amycolatopsis sp. FDAARGOS 1241]|uniref:DsbA family oxidoreductase n=1 Tax=Amycolatopsis sp. FDAARGOS 1241 TaxID=2778070 RepID=UPI00194E9624|nr:DsbA family protein [Amycolatopsis sp. FDAARGOS 1241]QRP47775.1 DsbA family protein [Amycolatopsis sp. FDAARGOS 1241]